MVSTVDGSFWRPRVTAREVGRVAALWRYPVKSMAPEALERVEVGWHGVAGDRRWAFVRAGQERSGFPWLTIREHPALARYQPRLVDPASPDKTAVRIRTPDGVELDAVDPALAAELGPGVQVMKLDRLHPRTQLMHPIGQSSHDLEVEVHLRARRQRDAARADGCGLWAPHRTQGRALRSSDRYAIALSR